MRQGSIDILRNFEQPPFIAFSLLKASASYYVNISIYMDLCPLDAGAGPGRDTGPQQPQARPRGGRHLHPHRARGGAANHLCQIETLPHTVPKVTCCRNTETDQTTKLQLLDSLLQET